MQNLDETSTPSLAERYEAASRAYLAARTHFESAIMAESARLAADLNLQALHDEHSRLWEAMYQLRTTEASEIAAAEAAARREFRAANAALKAMLRENSERHKRRRAAVWEAGRALALYEQDPTNPAAKDTWERAARAANIAKLALVDSRPEIRAAKLDVGQKRKKVAEIKCAPKPLQSLSLNLFPPN